MKQRLLIDMITFTLHIDIDQRLILLDRLNDPEFYEQYKRKVLPNSNGRYKNNYIFTIFESETIDVSVYPINTHHNFLRVKYNPTKLTSDGRIALREFFMQLLGTRKTCSIYFNAIVTRLDLTLDVFEMQPAKPYIHKNRALNSSLYRGLDGQILSQVIGSEKSRTLITMYDKAIEQYAKVLDKEFQPERERIEIRMRDLRCTMHNLGEDLADEFNDLNFYSSEFLTDTNFSRKFRNDAFNHGLNAALDNLEFNTRRRYRKQLENHRVQPISLDLNFNKAQQKALKSLVNTGYKQMYLSQTA